MHHGLSFTNSFAKAEHHSPHWIMAEDEALFAAAAAGGWIIYAEGKDNESSFEGKRRKP